MPPPGDQIYKLILTHSEEYGPLKYPADIEKNMGDKKKKQNKKTMV